MLKEQPILTFPSVKHAIIKDGAVQHQVVQRWAIMEIERGFSLDSITVSLFANSVNTEF